MPTGRQACGQGGGLRAKGWGRRLQRSTAALSPQPLALPLALLIALLAAARVTAHDIPNEVSIHVFVKPDGQHLRVVVRVPLVAMRDMDYPRRGGPSSGLLDLARAEATLRDAATLWVADDVEMYEEDTRLAYPSVTEVRAALPSDRSFESYEAALAHLTGPRLPDDTEFLWTQGMLDVLFEYPVHSEQSHFSIRPKLARLGLRTITTLRFLPPSGDARTFEFPGDPGLVHLDPRWSQTVSRFVSLGFSHLLDSVDRLLFLFCLVIPFRRFESLVAVVTSFAAAHSITLIASAYGFAPDALWFAPLVQTLIAMSVVYIALENIVAPDLERRWLMTFGFGLVHGFGFSFGLRQVLQFAGSHALTAVLSFNAGIELGLLIVLVLMIPALDLLFRFVVAERLGTIILSALATHTAWHWLIERGDTLRQYRFEWPSLDIAFWIAAMRWAMLAVIAAGVYWLIFSVVRPRREEVRSLKSEV
ncbi:MAG: HupE/UreJ family protein [Acidobacteria bacterium]|nr:HupE/UreJ family protein [Acidobacteriota bacterium]